MGCQIPKHIDVGLDKTQVDPDGINEQDLTELVGFDQFPNFQGGRRVAVGVVRHQDQAAICRCLDHLQPQLSAGGQRLLHQNVFSCLECLQSDEVVGARRRGNRDGVNLDCAEQRRQ